MAAIPIGNRHSHRQTAPKMSQTQFCRPFDNDAADRDLVTASIDHDVRNNGVFGKSGHGSCLRLVEFDEQPRSFDAREGRCQDQAVRCVLAELRPDLIARLEEAFGEVEGLGHIEADRDGIDRRGTGRRLRFGVLTKVSDMPFDSGLRTGVENISRLRAQAIAAVSLAMLALPLSDSHSTACGTLMVPKRRSTVVTVRSRTVSLEMPALAMAGQAKSCEGETPA